MKETIEQKVEKELQVIETMVTVYCKGKKHTRTETGRCAECEELLEYAKARTRKCPRKEVKTFCNTCPIHCYRKDYRETMKEVMKYAGPRMLYLHPVIAVKHMINTIKNKRKEKQNK